MRANPSAYAACLCYFKADEPAPVILETVGTLAHCVGWFQYHVSKYRPFIACGEVFDFDSDELFYEFSIAPTRWSTQPRLTEVIHARDQNYFREPSLLRSHAAAFCGVGSLEYAQVH